MNQAVGWTILVAIMVLPFGLAFAFPAMGLALSVLCVPLVVGFWSSDGWDQIGAILFGGLILLSLLGSGLGYLIKG